MKISMLLIALAVLATAVSAEEIVLKNGSVVKGDLIGYENGVYTVQIGRFMKSIPDSEVTDVRTGGQSLKAAVASTPAPAAPAGTVPARPALPAARTSAGVPAVAGGGGPATLPAAPSAVVPPGAVSELFDRLGGGKREGDGSASAAAIVQQIMGRGGRVDQGDLEALRDNPFMGKLIERFADPNYQRSLLEGIQEMQDKVGTGQTNPMADQLKGLFEQLNQIRRSNASMSRPVGDKPAAPEPAGNPEP